MEEKNYKALYEEAINQLSVKKKFAEDLVNINNDLIKLNKKISISNQNLMFENMRMKDVQKHGAFLEYDNDPKSIKFVPVLSNLYETATDKIPTKLMFTFKFSDFETWAMNLHNLMSGKNELIEFIDKKDLE